MRALSAVPRGTGELATRGRDRRDAGPARDAHAAVSRPIRGTGANRLTVALRDRQALALGRRAIVEQPLARRARESGVSGRSVSGGVDFGGRSSITKQKTEEKR